MSIHFRVTGLLQTLALAIALLSIPLTQLFAPELMPIRTSAISSRLANYTIPSTFMVEAEASTGGGCDITALRLYVDNKRVYTAPKEVRPAPDFP